MVQSSWFWNAWLEMENLNMTKPYTICTWSIYVDNPFYPQWIRIFLISLELSGVTRWPRATKHLSALPTLCRGKHGPAMEQQEKHQTIMSALYDICILLPPCAVLERTNTCNEKNLQHSSWCRPSVSMVPWKLTSTAHFTWETGSCWLCPVQ